MGEGPFDVRYGKLRAKIVGLRALSSIREIWVRDVYRLDELPTSGTIIDLGANRGFFTAAAAATGCHVIAVEPSRVGVKAIEELCKLNQWPNVRVCNAFLGGDTPAQHDSAAIPDHDSVPFLSEAEFIQRYGITSVDFLKCDIEGSEFELFINGGALLAMTEHLAMEVHFDAGSLDEMVRSLETRGFAVTTYNKAPNGCMLQARRKRNSPI